MDDRLRNKFYGVSVLGDDYYEVRADGAIGGGGVKTFV